MLVARPELRDSHRNTIEEEQLVAEGLKRLENFPERDAAVLSRTEELLHEIAVRRKQHEQPPRHGCLACRLHDERPQPGKRDETRCSYAEPFQQSSPPPSRVLCAVRRHLLGKPAVFVPALVFSTTAPAAAVSGDHAHRANATKCRVAMLCRGPGRSPERRKPESQLACRSRAWSAQPNDRIQSACTRIAPGSIARS